MKNFWGTIVLKIWSQIFDFFSDGALHVLWIKSFFKLILIRLKKNKSTFKTQLRIFFSKNLRPLFKKSFVPTIWYVFCARLQNGTQKSYGKPNTSVLLSTLWILQIFIHLWAFLLLYGLVSNFFTMFFRDCLERCGANGDFGYITKNQTFLF